MPKTQLPGGVQVHSDFSQGGSSYPGLSNETPEGSFSIGAVRAVSSKPPHIGLKADFEVFQQDHVVNVKFPTKFCAVWALLLWNKVIPA